MQTVFALRHGGFGKKIAVDEAGYADVGVAGVAVSVRRVGLGRGLVSLVEGTSGVGKAEGELRGL